MYNHYLPLVMRQYVGLPDLIITGLVATTDGVQVVIKNQGTGPAVDEFWVDVYIDPEPPPTGVNQVWYDGRSNQGIVWAITNLLDPTSQPLPLLPGETFTLVYKDALVSDDYTSVTLPLSPGAVVYAQVDAVNLLTNYGGVLETHEALGGAYNNLYGPVYVTAGSLPGVRASTAGGPLLPTTLPPR